MINAVWSKVELITASTAPLAAAFLPYDGIEPAPLSSFVRKKCIFSTFPCFLIFNNPFCLSGTFCKRDF